MAVNWLSVLPCYSHFCPTPFPSTAFLFWILYMQSFNSFSLPSFHCHLLAVDHVSFCFLFVRVQVDFLCSPLQFLFHILVIPCHFVLHIQSLPSFTVSVPIWPTDNQLACLFHITVISFAYHSASIWLIGNCLIILHIESPLSFTVTVSIWQTGSQLFSLFYMNNFFRRPPFQFPTIFWPTGIQLVSLLYM